MRFIPRENGMHYIHVRLNGQHIAGSPFRVMVGKQDADASLVQPTATGSPAERQVRGSAHVGHCATVGARIGHRRRALHMSARTLR